MQNHNQPPVEDLELGQAAQLRATLRAFTESDEAVEQQTANGTFGHTVVEQVESGACFVVNCAEDDPNSGHFTLQELPSRLRDRTTEQNIHTLTVDLRAPEAPSLKVVMRNTFRQNGERQERVDVGTDALTKLDDLVGGDAMRVLAPKEARRVLKRTQRHAKDVGRVATGKSDPGDWVLN